LLSIEHYGFTQEELDKSFIIDLPNMDGLFKQKRRWTLREVKEALEKAYCGKLGVEYMHITDPKKANWLRDKFELRQYEAIPREERVLLLERLFWADMFSEFMSTKFNTMKRFGLEGVEGFIPGMKTAMDVLVQNGGEKAIIGMPHRGRLSLLGNVVRKPLETIFAEFIGTMPSLNKDTEQVMHSGDVKYHLGTSFTRTYSNGNKFTVEVLANPSHLECINPVVLGRVRAENHTRKLMEGGVNKFTNRNKVIPFLIHGDASFAG
jgi:2-oxoglutarate dehydrogenase E1 component